MSRDPLDNLNPRKRKYVQGRIEGKTKMQAALDAGYSKSVALGAAANIETPDVQHAFAVLIRKAIPAEKIVQRVAEGLDAMETKFFQEKGTVVETRDVIAWSDRRAYVELAAEFGGYFVPKKPSESSVVNNTQVIIEYIGTTDSSTAPAETK